MQYGTQAESVSVTAYCTCSDAAAAGHAAVTRVLLIMMDEPSDEQQFNY